MKDKTIQVLNMLSLAIIAGSLLAIAIHFTLVKPLGIELVPSNGEYPKTSVELAPMPFPHTPLNRSK